MKSAISGEYVIQINEEGSVKVFRIYDNVIGSLREIAESKGFVYDSNWNTRQFGSNIIKEFGEGNQAFVGEYVVTKRDNGSIETYREYDNTKGALREVSEKTGFTYDPSWNTRQFGSKLVDYLLTK